MASLYDHLTRPDLPNTRLRFTAQYGDLAHCVVRVIRNYFTAYDANKNNNGKHIRKNSADRWNS